MSVLIARIEQAFVGALLAQDFPWESYESDVRKISAAELTDPVRRDVFTTIVEMRENENLWIPGKTFVDEVCERLAGRGVTRGDVLRLVWACPNPTHIREYGRLLAVGRFRRHVAFHADAVAREAAGPHCAHIPQLAGLAAALDRSARLHAHLLPGEAGQDVPGPVPQPRRPAPNDPAQAREENVLSGLLIGGWFDSVMAFVPAKAFRTPLHREIYEALVAVKHRGGVIDRLSVAWEMAERRAESIGVATPGASQDRGLPPADRVHTDPASLDLDVVHARVTADLAFLDRMPVPRLESVTDDARAVLTSSIDASLYDTSLTVAATPPASGHVLPAQAARALPAAGARRPAPGSAAGGGSANGAAADSGRVSR
ncbi:DnaB-like helicase N-terminal domain-containing protein [Cryptosporangium sp. NPDC048952]|uniref:DnaB-like helicase N-terminal domain-containing protein n=1 Tax=Cryptosporangium sp. NPDC048952 TaxID=3363961 RepID=UPI00371B33FD